MYGWRREPFREVVLYEDTGWRGYRSEISAKYKGDGGGPIKRARRSLRHVRYNWEFWREQRRPEKDDH
jgi:hypothetical protein